MTSADHLSPAPEDRGWAPAQRLPLSEESHEVDRQWPSDGSCSVPHCDHPAVAAVHRSGGEGRAPYWQNYCAVHAYARGVVVGDESLEWTWEYQHLPTLHRR